MKVNWSTPSIGDEEKKAVEKVLDSGWLSQGKVTEEFERKFAQYIGCKYVVVVNSGTSALICALLAEKLMNTTISVPTYTFIAPVNAIHLVDSKPSFLDCDLHTFNLLFPLSSHSEDNIIIVNIAGMPCDVYNLSGKKKIIEDACQGIGAKYKHKMVGSLGHTTVFSFHMAKLLTTIEGGAIATNDTETAEQCRLIRNHGMKDKYIHKVFGLNLRTTDINSAIGITQLKKLDSFIAHRNKIAQIYKEELSEILRFQEVPHYVTRHPYMIFQAVLQSPNERDSLKSYLQKNDIDTRICWMPVHLQLADGFKRRNIYEKFPNAEYLYNTSLTLPIGNGQTIEQTEYVVEKVKEWAKRKS